MLLTSYPEWLRQGYQSDLVATAPRVGPLAEELRAAGYRVLHLPFRGKVPLLPRLDFLREFYRLCGSGYEVVHVHPEAAAPMFVLLAKLAGVPTIALTKHNVFRYRGGMRLRKYVERLLIRTMGGRYGMISESVQEREWSSFRNRGVRISNWIDTEHFRPASPAERAEARAAMGLRDETFAVLTVGNCNTAKNHQVLLQALPALGNADFVYLHVGREQENRAEQALAKTLGVEDRVRFLGSSADTRPAYWAADAFVMPSLYEGLGLSAIEAIAAGVPAILAQVEGLTDVLAETRNSLAIRPTTEDITEALRRVMAEDAAVRRSRALADSELVRRRFSVEQGVRSNIEALYHAEMSRTRVMAGD